MCERVYTALVQNVELLENLCGWIMIRSTKCGACRDQFCKLVIDR